MSLERLLRNVLEFLSGAIDRAMNILILPIYSEGALTNQPFTSLCKWLITHLIFSFLCSYLIAFASYSTVESTCNLILPSSQPETSNPCSVRAYQACPWGTVILAYSFTVLASPPCPCLSTPSFMEPSLPAPTMLLQQRMGILATTNFILMQSVKGSLGSIQTRENSHF